MTVLGLDFGLKRTGLAISNPEESFAMPLETVETSDLLDHLLMVIEQEPFDRIVLGYPLSIKGHENEMTKAVHDIKALLESRLKVEVILVDERFSTRGAKRIARQSGVKWKKGKKLKDEMSASIILQDYFDFYHSSRQ